MKSTILLILFLSIYVSAKSNLNGRVQYFFSILAIDTIKKCDPITKEHLFKLAKKGMAEMINMDTLSVEETISLVKVYNTFHNSEIYDGKDSLFVRRFIRKFSKEYFPIVLSDLVIRMEKG